MRFQRSKHGNPKILVMAPTRELVQQTCKVFTSLGGGKDVIAAEAYGGAPREIQARRLHGGCDVLVACPGRLNDFLQSGTVDLSELSFLVFDEADRLLDMGFKPQLDQIMSFVDPSVERQTMMWSATWPREVQQLARDYLKENRLLIRAGTCGTGQQVNENITQHVFFADTPIQKIEKMIELIQDGTIKEETCKMIIFVERQADTESVANLLIRKLGVQGNMIAPIHGGMQQGQRDYIMNSFKKNTVRILVATDVASRGLDFPDITCVINFQTPKAITDYCHRIGRTGRAGRKGDAFTFVSEGDPLLRDLVSYLRKCGSNVSEQLQSAADNAGYGRQGGGGFGRSRSRGFGGGGFRRGGGGFGRSRGGGGGFGGDRFSSYSRAGDEWM
jgi:ATP-dependent RNA helicase DDX5/DBP2